MGVAVSAARPYRRYARPFSARSWDLDVVRDTGKWLVVVPSPSELAPLPLFAKLETQASGTLVVWQDLDRLTAGARDLSREMTAKMSPLFEHLALVFHRFHQKEGNYPAVTVVVNGLPLPSRDPFLGENSYRQQLEGQTISHERGKVVVLPYVLPPVSNLSAQEIETAGGREGLRGTQGFYVYRSRRLVIWGTWFGLVPKEEFFKLTRIRVDIPNTFDDLWSLDIKKSAAHPPDPIRSRLKELIPHFAGTSKRTVTFNGRVVNAKAFVPVWNRIEMAPGRFRYAPNVEHPLITSLSAELPDGNQRHLQRVLEFLGSNIPYQGIYADMCTDHRSDDSDALLKELTESAAILKEVTELRMDEILDIDPIGRYPHLHASIREALNHE